MARTGYHSYSAGGMPMGHLPRRSPMGADPNYADGAYRGQRGQEGRGEAPYGHYRMQHGRELGGYGGVNGRNTGAGHLQTPPPSRPSGPVGGPRPGSPIELRGRTPGRPMPQQGGFGFGPGAPQARGRYDRETFRMQGSRPDRGRIRFAESPPPRAGRGGAGPGAPSRAARYDGSFDQRSGFRSQGFSEGFLGSGFRG